MPLIYNNSYKRPFYALNTHFETIIPSAIRKVKEVNYKRERIATHDDDFLDIDWVQNNNNRLLIISHGLEGSSDRPYVKGMAKLFAENQWDILAWNCRSCSGEINRKKLLYHHGFTIDLECVVKKATTHGYDEICLVGFSMGGSLTLKYLGEYSKSLHPSVKKGMAVSVPCDLKSSSEKLALKQNKFYQNRFMKKLAKKMELKNRQFPDFVVLKPWKEFKDFHEFDTHYAANIFGFKDASDFYANVQCLPFLKHIELPTLILNAWNDPLLAESCFPIELAKSKENLTLEITQQGGHVGFMQQGKTHTYAEERALKFFNADS